MAILGIAVALWSWVLQRGDIDSSDPAVLARGQQIYGSHCASCHGVNLEGQHNWRIRNDCGRVPAPPHDASGHTWHHPNAILFGITKEGLAPGKFAPPNYQSDMPAFGGTLSDADIRTVLAYIKSTWPEDIRAKQRQIDRSAADRR